MPLETSRYTPIWEKLKKEKIVRIAAPQILHRRFIKAVQKRRDKDFVYRFILEEQGLRARLGFKSENTILIFKLDITARISSL